MSVTLFPRATESHVDIHATVDKVMLISIISRGVLDQLRVDYTPCQNIEETDERGASHRPFGMVELQWNKEGIALQYPETFYIVESSNMIVIFGRSALSKLIEDEGGAYPLGLGKQTPGMV